MAHDNAMQQWHEVDEATVEGAAIEADRFGAQYGRVKDAIAGSVFEVGPSIHAHNFATEKALCHRFAWDALIARAEVDMPAIVGSALSRMRQIRVEGRPRIRILERTQCVIAQDPRVVAVTIITRCEDHVTPIEGCTIVSHRIQSIRATCVKSFPRGRIVEVTMCIATQNMSVDAVPLSA